MRARWVFLMGRFLHSRMGAGRGWTVACATLVGALAVAVAPAPAATIKVDPSAPDSATSGAECSLREAISSANLDAAVGDCSAGSGADTIKLPAGTYKNALTNCASTFEDANLCGDLDITSDVTIKGAGAAKTAIDGNQIDRVINIFRNGGPPADQNPKVTIDGVTIKGGQGPPVPSGHDPSGGGIEVFDSVSSLTLNKDVISGNVAGGGGGGNGGAGGGIWSAGTLRLNQTTVKGNTAGSSGDTYFGGAGGGVYMAQHAALFVNRSTVSGNSGGEAEQGGSGGGIEIQGPAVIASSTISANHAGEGDRGPGGAGGGIDDRNLASLVLVNSTVQGNGAGDSIMDLGGSGGGVEVRPASGGGTVTLINDTIAGNSYGAGLVGGTDGQGGGLRATDIVTVRNSLLADNDGSNCSGGNEVSDGGHNLSFGDGSCPGTFAFGDPGLGPLKANGGPTRTMAISTAGAATDKVPSAGANCPATDQRGVGRPQGPACDIGAYEIQLPPGTSLKKTEIDSGSGKAKFVFSATDPSAGFQCSLARRGKAGKFKSCKSPKRYRNLSPGRYVFEVRAVDAAGKDGTPAKQGFRIRK